MTAEELDAGTRKRVKESDAALIRMACEAGLSPGHVQIVDDAMKLRRNLLTSYLQAAAAVDALMEEKEASA